MPVGRHGRRARLLEWHAPRVPHLKPARGRARRYSRSRRRRRSRRRPSRTGHEHEPGPAGDPHEPRGGGGRWRPAMTSTGLASTRPSSRSSAAAPSPGRSTRRPCASSWQADARRGTPWPSATVAHDRHTVHQYRHLADRYNQLVLEHAALAAAAARQHERAGRRRPAASAPRSPVPRLRRRRRRSPPRPGPADHAHELMATARIYHDDRRLGVARHRHHLADPPQRRRRRRPGGRRSRQAVERDEPRWSRFAPTATSRA